MADPPTTTKLFDWTPPKPETDADWARFLGAYQRGFPDSGPPPSSLPAPPAAQRTKAGAGGTGTSNAAKAITIVGATAMAAVGCHARKAAGRVQANGRGADEEADDKDDDDDGDPSDGDVASVRVTADAKSMSLPEFYDLFGYLPAPRPPNQMLRLTALRRYGLDSASRRDFLEPYTELARTLLRTRICHVSIITEDELFVPASDGSAVIFQDRKQAVCPHALLFADKGIFVVKDMAKDWRFAKSPIIKQYTEECNAEPRFYAGAPLVLRGEAFGEGTVIGVLALFDPEPRTDFTEVEGGQLSMIADMVVQAIERAFYAARHIISESMAKATVGLIRKRDAPPPPPYSKHEGDDMVIDTAAGDDSSPDLTSELFQDGVDTMRGVLHAESAWVIDLSGFHLSYQSGTSPLPSSDDDEVSNTTESEDDEVQGHDYHHDHHHHQPSSRPCSPSPSRTPPLDVPDAVTPSFITYKPRRSVSADADAVVVSAARFSADRPVPLLASSVSDGAKPRRRTLRLTGARARSSIATYLRHLQEHRLAGEKEATHTHVLRSSETPRYLLRPIMPDGGSGTFMVVPVFELDQQPAFLLLVVFESPYEMVEEIDKRFAEQLGAILLGSFIRERVHAVDRAQIRFIQQMQHETRTPLNGILGSVEMISQSLSAHHAATDNKDKAKTKGGGGGGPCYSPSPEFLAYEAELEEHVNAIAVSGRTLKNILDDVLEFGKVVGFSPRSSSPPPGKDASSWSSVLDDDVKEERLNVGSMMEAVARQEWNDRIQKLPLTPSPGSVDKGSATTPEMLVPELIVNLPPKHEMTVSCAGPDVRRILHKLVSNALKFTREGYVELCLRAVKETGKGGTYLEFVVDDTGSGMSKSFIDQKLFKPFSKADAFSAGAGLSMTLCATIIKRIGGTLRVQSEAGVGTRVVCSIPVKSPSRQPEAYDESAKGVRVVLVGFKDTSGRRLAPVIRQQVGHAGIIVVSNLAMADLVIFRGDSPDQDLARLKQHLGGCKPTVEVIYLTTAGAKAATAFPSAVSVPFHVAHRPYGPTAFSVILSVASSVKARMSSGPASPTMTTTTTTTTEEQRGQSLLPSVSSYFPPVETAAFASLAVDSGPILSAQPLKNVSRNSLLTTPMSAEETPSPPYSSIRPPGWYDPREEPFTALVVEDNPLNLRILTALLKRHNIPFIEAYNGLGAVEAFKAYLPSVTLLDISMPVMDGFEASRLIREVPTRRRHRIVAITALSSPVDKKRGLLDCRMDGWITKPVVIKALSNDLSAWKKEWDEEVGHLSPTNTGSAGSGDPDQPAATTAVVPSLSDLAVGGRGGASALESPVQILSSSSGGTLHTLPPT